MASHSSHQTNNSKYDNQNNVVRQLIISEKRQPNKKVYIGNINPETTDEDLRLTFVRFGELTNDSELKVTMAWVNAFKPTFQSTLNELVSKGIVRNMASEDDCCYKCGEKGHWSVICTNPNPQRLKQFREQRQKDYQQYLQQKKEYYNKQRELRNQQMVEMQQSMYQQQQQAQITNSTNNELSNLTSHLEQSDTSQQQPQALVSSGAQQTSSTGTKIKTITNVNMIQQDDMLYGIEVPGQFYNQPHPGDYRPYQKRKNWVKCFKCGKAGHYKTECRVKYPGEKSKVEYQDPNQ
eukprot:403338714